MPKTLAAFALVLALSGVARAAPLETNDLLRVVRADKGKILVKELSYGAAPTSDKLTLVHIDKAMNAAKATNTWSGRSYRSILADFGVTKGDAAELVLVGSDDYQAQITTKTVFDHPVLLATHKDGVRTEWLRGGAMTIFPYEGMEPRFREAGYWVWQISAVIVGELPPILAYDGGKKSLDLASLKGQSRTGPRLFPVGQRERGVPAAMTGSYSSLSLEALRAAVSAPKGKKLVLATYNGHELEVDPAKDDHEIVYQWDGKPIPPAFGGPIQICTKAKAPSCRYYLRSVGVR